MALAWVEEDCGVSIAQEVAREPVLFLRRSGKQQQVSISLCAQASLDYSTAPLELAKSIYTSSRAGIIYYARRHFRALNDPFLLNHNIGWSLLFGGGFVQRDRDQNYSPQAVV